MLNHQSRLLMVTGVARSGTTLLAEALDHHPQVMCAPDPMDELFRAFMHFCYYKLHGLRKKADEPMDHFFFQGSPKVFSFLGQTDMRHNIPEFMRENLLLRISHRGGSYCPEIKEQVLRCRAQRFDELILEIMTLLQRAYGKSSCRYFGFKDAWSEQLIIPMSKTFPNMMFINIIRDPRAVISSNYASKSAYPLFFNIRDWRKSVYYSWRYQAIEKDLNGRFQSLLYENLIAHPEQTLQRVTDFLGLSYSEAMIKVAFKPSNTSYGRTEQRANISDKFKDKWKAHLPVDKRIQVEIFCEPEMKRMGYQMLDSGSQNRKGFQALWSHDIEFDKLGPWCRKLVHGRLFYSTVWQWIQRTMEFIRIYLYRHQKGSPTWLRHFFYDPLYFSWLIQESNAQGRGAALEDGSTSENIMSSRTTCVETTSQRKDR